MKVLALRFFRYSRDGVTELLAQKGEEPDVPDNLVEGLVAAGAVELLDESAPAPPAPKPKEAKK